MLADLAQRIDVERVAAAQPLHEPSAVLALALLVSVTRLSFREQHPRARERELCHASVDPAALQALTGLLQRWGNGYGHTRMFGGHT